MASVNIKNRKAWHEYIVLDELECGIVLVGCEVKSIRTGNVSLTESFARIDAQDDLYICGMHIPLYEKDTTVLPDPMRTRKLLAHNREIRRLRKRLDEGGMTLIPLRLYFNKSGRCKIRIGLCRSKGHADRREDMKKRDHQREIAREMTRER